MRHQRDQKGLALLLAAALLLTLAGCAAGGETGPSPTPAAAESPSPSPAVDGDALTVCVGGEPESMDPAVNGERGGNTLLGHVFEGLMKWAPGDKKLEEGLTAAQLVPGMAERYERVSTEGGGAVYTFHLRPAKWSDGKPVTAQDFVYAWQRAVGGGSSVPYGDLLRNVGNAQAVWTGEAQSTDLAVRAVDETTFEVTLSQDEPWFLEVCALPLTAPLRQDALEQGGNQWTYAPETYLTNGPYKLRAWNHNDRLILEKDPEYYEEVTGPETITFLLQDDPAAIAAAWEAETLDLARGAEVKAGEVQMSAPCLASYYLVFQTRKAPFDQAAVRQAFALAMDRAKVVEAAGGGHSPAGALVPTGAREADGKDFRRTGGDYLDPAATAANCDRARSLLAQAGYPEGAGFPEVEYLCPDSPVHKAVAQVLAQTWKEELGVSVTVKAQEWGAFLHSAHQGEFSIARGRWVADHSDPMSFLELWTTGAEGNDGGYAQEAYDQLLDRARTAADPAGRIKALHQAEQRLVGSDWALAPVYFENQSFLVKDALRGVSYTPQGGFLFTGCQKK